MDRWKGKEAIKTIAGYVLALSVCSPVAVESPPKHLSDLVHWEHGVFETSFWNFLWKEKQQLHHSLITLK